MKDLLNLLCSALVVGLITVFSQMEWVEVTDEDQTTEDETVH